MCVCVCGWRNRWRRQSRKERPCLEWTRAPFCSCTLNFEQPQSHSRNQIPAACPPLSRRWALSAERETLSFSILDPPRWVINDQRSTLSAERWASTSRPRPRHCSLSLSALTADHILNTRPYVNFNITPHNHFNPRFTTYPCPLPSCLVLSHLHPWQQLANVNSQSTLFHTTEKCQPPLIN